MNGPDPASVFRIEAGELLDQIEHGLLDLGGGSGDLPLIDEVFRGLHTLKGSGAMFGFDALAAFTHHCESAFDGVRKGSVALSQPLISVILAAQDHMRLLLDDGDELGPASDLILARLQAVLGEAPEPVPASLPARPSRGAGWRLSFRLPPDAMANGTNPVILLDELRALGECRIVARTDAIPPLAALVPTQCHIGWDVTLATDAPRSAIEDVFIFVMDDMQLEI